MGIMPIRMRKLTHAPVGDTKESYSFLVQIKFQFDAIMLKFLAITEKGGRNQNS